MNLENYFKKIIEEELIEGSWLFLGLNEEEKFSFVFSLAELISDPLNIFLLAEREKFPSFFLEKYRVHPLSIDDVREAINFLYLTSERKKVLIVRNLEDLDFTAQNALLKTVEEPPPKATLFLLAKNEEGVLPTIASRTKIIKLPIFNFRDYFQKRIDPEIYRLFQESFKDNRLFQEKLKNDPLLFLENLLIFWRDQVFNKFNLREFKITEIEGEESPAFLKQALELFSLLSRYHLNPRLQIENLLFQWRK